MAAIFLQTLPFFALIGLGFAAGRTGFFTPEATGYLTKFVFYFALSAMLFRFSATLELSAVFDIELLKAYFAGTIAVYLLATLVAYVRRLPMPEAAVEAQCAVIGNTGFLGIPMFILLLGEQSVGPTLLTLAVDLIFFSSLITILISASKGGGLGLASVHIAVLGLLRNPMILAMSAGLIWSATDLTIPQPFDVFLTVLGAAATPGALFAIGASLSEKSSERPAVASWLTFCKLVLHPAAVAMSALLIFDVAHYPAAVMIAVASLPVAGNVYMLAMHYGVAPQRVSTAILFSTLVSILTVTLVIGWVQGLY